MLYLLDANVLIDANRDYYPMDRVPEFWSWLEHFGSNEQVKIPVEVYEELSGSKKDLLAEWAKDANVKEALLLNEDASPPLVAQVTEMGYASDLNDVEIKKVGRDPFLIAYALSDPGNRCIVTTEVSKPSAQRGNRKVPDVCAQFGVPTCTSFEFIRRLNFRTDWQ